MYLSSIKFENTGPLDQLNLKLEAPEDRAPLPLVFVGANGSGKSIVLAQIASALINAHGATFEDSDVEKGKVFKLRSGSYIRHGENYSFSELEFSDDFFEREIVLNRTKQNFEENLKFSPLAKDWRSLGALESSHLNSNFHNNPAKIRQALAGPHIYFPPNRFEDPAWINELSLRNKIDYSDLKRFEGLSNRKVIEYAPMKENQSWLLDLIYDSFAIERRLVPLPNNVAPNAQLGVIHQAGPATTLRTKIDEFLLLLLGGTGPITWNLGMRSSRSIGITASDGVLTSNLFALSTGQSLVLDLFLTILRHADWSMPQVNTLEEIEGMVVIDEVDLHLHTDLQYRILPKLISMFPRIQFIMSSHSPLFLLGLEKELGEGGTTIVDLPGGLEISAERFAEFESAYDQFSKTRKFEEEVGQKVKEATTPLLIVEGTIDIDYLKKAAEHLEKTELLSKFELLDGDGYGGLNKIWKNFNVDRWTSANQTVILLYDCDVNEKNNEVGKAFQRTIPARDSAIEKGIENLLPQSTVDAARGHKLAFFDYVPAATKIVRGEEINEPEQWSVNPDEKRNLCDWVCENGNAEDFENFAVIFEIIENCLG